MGVSSDGASNMRSPGAGSLTSLIAIDLPWTWSIHDVAHCLHLLCKHSVLILPKEIFSFIHTITAKFVKSFPLRRLLTQIQTKRNKKALSMIRFIPTRWGSLTDCIIRILEIWDDIYLLFTQKSNEENEISRNDDEDTLEDPETTEYWEETLNELKELTNDPIYMSSITKDILDKAWKKDFNLKPYLEFCKIILSIVMEKIKYFQKDQVSIMSLISELKDLCFVLADYILVEKNEDYTINDLDQIFGKNKLYSPTGPFKEKNAFISYLNLRYDSIDYVSILDIDNWVENCKKMVFESISRLLHYIPFDDPTLSLLECTRLKQVKVEDWVALSKRFNNIVKPEELSKLVLQVDKLKWDKETLEQLHKTHKGNLLAMWKDLRNVNKYDLVCKLAFASISLPISSVFVERAFKIMKEIKSDKRNRLLTENLEAFLLINQFSMENSLRNTSFLRDVASFYHNKKKPDIINNLGIKEVGGPHVSVQGLADNVEDDLNMVNLDLDKLSIANNMGDEVLELLEEEDEGEDEMIIQNEFDQKTEEQNERVIGDINDEKEIKNLQDLKSIPVTPQKPIQTTLKQMFSTTSKKNLKRKDIETGRIERDSSDLKQVKFNE